MDKIKVGIIGVGFVGNAIYKSCKKKGIDVCAYDKYKEVYYELSRCLNSDILFLALPTLYDNILGEYDKSAIIETCNLLVEEQYDGVVVIKSTVEPETVSKLSMKYKTLHMVHNPEFLTARVAISDYHNQKHVVLGRGDNCSDEKYELVKSFYEYYYPQASISLCSSLESESMKIYLNCFYATKVQFFTELYQLCQKNNTDYNKIKKMMLKNDWINPMHTTVPGPDGNLSYGGMCFPKDTIALFKYMERYDSDSQVLKATIEERNKMR